MDKQILCRAYRKKTDSWLSLVVPEMENREDKIVWIETACGNQFMPEVMKPVPVEMIDIVIESFVMESSKRKHDNGPDNNDSWPEDGGPNFV